MLRAFLHPRDVVYHAAALIEHDDDLYELDLVDEQGRDLGHVVVEDLEVLLREVRDEPSRGVRHGDEERNGLSTGFENRWLLLLRGRADGQNHDESKP